MFASLFFSFCRNQILASHHAAFISLVKDQQPLMTDQEIILQLISVGRDAVGSVTPDLSPLRRCDHINRIGWKKWKMEASHLSNTDLINLIKGITYVERELKWIGGSVAGGIWLFSMLLNLGAPIEEIDETAAWVIKNTRNPYNPFGTIVTLGANNYSEYQKLSHERQILIQRELERDKDFEREAKEQRNLRKQSRLFSAQHRNSPEREELIENLNGMAVRDQLILISKDEKHAPNFYPTRCADSADITVIESLPEEAMYVLANKMKGKYRGPWSAFKKRLLSACGPVGDKEPWKI
jgi:hypothetical protein